MQNPAAPLVDRRASLADTESSLALLERARAGDRQALETLRTLCMTFEAQIQVIDASLLPLAPAPGCSSATLGTLAKSTGGVTDLNPGASDYFAHEPPAGCRSVARRHEARDARAVTDFPGLLRHPGDSERYVSRRCSSSKASSSASASRSFGRPAARFRRISCESVTTSTSMSNTRMWFVCRMRCS